MLRLGRNIGVFVACGLVAGCLPRTAPPVEPEPPAVAVAPLVVPEVGPVPEEAFEPALLPEDLAGRLGTRNYQFRRDGEMASLSITLENLQANDPIELELAARFEDSAGNAFLQTDWVRARIPPRGRYPYVAHTGDVRAAGGKILLRMPLAADQ